MRASVWRDDRGSTTLEAAVSLVFLASAFTMGLSLAYAGFARVWLDRAAYEATVCLAAKGTRTRCTSKLITAIKRGLPIGETSDLRLALTPNDATAQVEFRLGDKIRLHAKERLRLPLRSAPDRSWL
jgi:hypothetical protein